MVADPDNPTNTLLRIAERQPKIGERWAFAVDNDSTQSIARTANTANAAGPPAVAQVDNITISGKIEAGDKFSLSVNSRTYTYKAAGGDTADKVRDGLTTLVNADGSAIVAASNTSTTGRLTLTAKAAGTAFTANVLASNRAKNFEVIAKAGETIDAVMERLNTASDGVLSWTPNDDPSRAGTLK
ncbi:MAG: hypothetical protein ACKOGH_05960, partial [Alphaproteobacteria bacterium]